MLLTVVLESNPQTEELEWRWQQGLELALQATDMGLDLFMGHEAGLPKEPHRECDAAQVIFKLGEDEDFCGFTEVLSKKFKQLELYDIRAYVYGSEENCATVQKILPFVTTIDNEKLAQLLVDGGFVFSY